MRTAYTCHNVTVQKNVEYEIPNGYYTNEEGVRVYKMGKHITRWDDIACGHVTSGIDPYCEGCFKRRSQ